MPPAKPPPGFSPNPEAASLQALAPVRLEVHPFAKAADRSPHGQKEKANFFSEAQNWVGTRIENVLFQQYKATTSYSNHIETSPFVLMHDYVGEVKILEKARRELRTAGVSKTAAALMEEEVCKNQIALEAHLQYSRDTTRANIEAQTKLAKADPAKMKPDEYASLQKIAEQTQREQVRAENIYKAQELSINTQNTQLDNMISAVGGRPRTPHERYQRTEEMKADMKAAEGNAQERYQHRLAKAGRSHKRYEESILTEYQRFTSEEREAVEAMKIAAGKIMKSGDNNQIDLQRAQLQKHRCNALKYQLDQEWEAYRQAQGGKIQAVTLEQKAKEVPSQKKDDLFTQLKRALKGQAEQAKPKSKLAVPPRTKDSERTEASPKPIEPAVGEKAEGKRVIRLRFKEKQKLLTPAEASVYNSNNARVVEKAMIDTLQSELGAQIPFTGDQIFRGMARDETFTSPQYPQLQEQPEVWLTFSPLPLDRLQSLPRRGIYDYADLVAHFTEFRKYVPKATWEIYRQRIEINMRKDFAEQLQPGQINGEALRRVGLNLARYCPNQPEVVQRLESVRFEV